ncbi:MAG: helix-turn-helix transcriptional regulator [Clostridia bacterium]|nr:helix-turn-helix transcriptional regulator [Clostridia bacterium]
MYEIFVELLQKNNVTAYQVCKATGIAPATISDWKNNKSTPKNDKLKKIADYFGVSLDYLTTGKQVDRARVTDEDVKLALFGGDGDVTDAMWEEAMFAIELIKKRHEKRSN